MFWIGVWGAHFWFGTVGASKGGGRKGEEGGVPLFIYFVYLFIVIFFY